MVKSYFHGLGLKEIDQTERVLGQANSSIVGLVGTAPKGENNKPLVVRSLREAVTFFGEPEKRAAGSESTNTIPRALHALLEQGVGAVVVIKVDPPTLGEGASLESVLGGYDEETGSYTGIKLLENVAKEPVGVDNEGNPVLLSSVPKILICPEYSSSVEIANALVKAASTLRGIAVIDCPNTGNDQAKTFAAGVSSSFAYLCYPEIDFGGKVGVVGLSAAVAGVISRVDAEEGFWISPSNKQIYSAIRLSKGVSWSLTDPESDAAGLNEAGITTVIRQDGFRVWGNLTRAGQADDRFKFISVRRIANAINDTVLKNHFWAVDQNITKSYFQTVTNSLNTYLRSLQADGAILGGRAFVDPEKNTPSDIKSGHAVFSFEFTPVYPASAVSFESIMTDTYITEIFK